MYADRLTDSMQRAIDETERRRQKQMAYNDEHGITPRTIYKSREEILQQTLAAGDREEAPAEPAKPWEEILQAEHTPRAMVEMLEAEMRRAAKELNFERAAQIRDRIEDLKAQWGIGSQEARGS
jgi:excinuclease ABC subunit B